MHVPKIKEWSSKDTQFALFGLPNWWVSYTLICMQSYELLFCSLLLRSCYIILRGEVHNFACAFALSNTFAFINNLSNVHTKTKRERQVIPEISSRMDGAVSEKCLVNSQLPTSILLIKKNNTTHRFWIGFCPTTTLFWNVH